MYFNTYIETDGYTIEYPDFHETVAEAEKWAEKTAKGSEYKLILKPCTGWL